MAAEAFVSAIMEQLISITAHKVQQEVRLVTGVKKEIKKLTSNFQAIQAVLVDAEQRQIKDKAVADWLDKLKDVSYDMEDVLDEWNTAILKLQIDQRVENAFVPKKKVCFCLPLPRFCFKQVALRHDIGRKIKEIDESLDLIAKEKDTYNFNQNIRRVVELERSKTTSFVDVSTILGRDIEKNSLVTKLLSESPVEGKNLPVISIVGMGGIGKTTLAQFAYNDKGVENNFHKRIWICVSDPFDEIRIAKTIIQGLTNDVAKSEELQDLLICIQGFVVKTKFLLILDDVWTEDNNKWEPLYNTLNNGLHGSKILVTTRKTTVAHMIKSTDIINIEKLSKDGSWLLFKQLAFAGRSQQEREILVEIGKKIVDKCNGLPLAIKTIGSLLHLKKTREQWKGILESEMWQLEKLEQDVFCPLLLSYNDLPSKIKRCFVYCAIFPKDYNIEKDELINLWMAQGYLNLEQNKDLELIGEDYFENLAMRSFFQEFENDENGNIIGCKMHDIVHDFALFLVKKDCFAVEIDTHEVLSLDHSYEKAHHSMLIVNNQEASFPLNKCGIQKLRSLLVQFGYMGNLLMQNELLQSNLFEQLTFLRSLKITNPIWKFDWPIHNISKEVGNLIHLRYLCLENLRIQELPDTLCDLVNLQTLYLIACFDLTNLPQEIGKLVNLRHLILEHSDNLQYQPKGVERLTNLRTLSTLIVGVIGDSDILKNKKQIDGSDAGGREVCTLDCLKNLNHLRGQLTLRGLSNVIDGGEAKNARLKNKEYIDNLRLLFDTSSSFFAKPSKVSSNKDEVVGSRLSFGQSSESSEASSLVLDEGEAQNAQLKDEAVGLRLSFGQSSESSEASSLVLDEDEAKNAQLKDEAVGLRLSFDQSNESSEASSSSSSSQAGEGNTQKDEAVLEALEPPPYLKQLGIYGYGGIAFPNWIVSLTTSLKKINIIAAYQCEYLPALGKLPLLETLEISQMRRLKRVGNEFLGVENSSDASSSSSSPAIAFPLLKDLLLFEIPKWKEWEYENRKDIIIMPSLSELNIYDCPKLKALPDHLLHSTSLKHIAIRDAFKCEYLPALGKLPLLETLNIWKMRRLKRVGNEFLGVENSSSASSSSPAVAFPLLKSLWFSEIPKWEEWEYENRKDIIIMPSLSSLDINFCPKLKALPDHLLHSTSLKKLDISGSSLLENWCETKGIQFTTW